MLNTQYIPHGHCYLWQTRLMGLHIAADAMIAIAYFLMLLILIYFVRQVKELPFQNIFILFGAFILSCGAIHIVEIWTLWHPNYWLFGIFKAITALTSLYSACSLIPIIPLALELPSPQHLAKLNQQLNQQIIEKEVAKEKVQQLNKELEQRVAEKTSALLKANQDLQEITRFREQLNDLMPNILYIYDLATSQNVYCNAFVTELLGYSAEEVQKFKDSLLDELIHPEDLPLLKDHFANCFLLENDQYLDIEYRIKNTTGQWHWLYDKNTVFARNSSGEVTQILGIAQDVTQTKQVQLQSKELNRKLAEKIKNLKIRDHARIKLAQLNGFVQACTNLEEVQHVIADLLKPLFPHTTGVVYLMSNSKNLLEAIATWGDSDSESNFEPKKCWAIRRGIVHISHPQSPKLYCSHIDRETELKPCLCLPMIAKGESIGMLHLSFNHQEIIAQTVQDLAENVAQNLAMSFANLQLLQKLRYQSLHDPLTNLYNRRYLLESFKQELERAERQKQSIGVMILDIDYFKRFNDIYGHSAGDLVLSQIGAYLLSAIRQYDVACRYGGEELVIILPDTSMENIIMCAERIRAGVNKLKLEHEGQQLDSISVSIGVACFPDDGIDVEKLIKAADKALYDAKEAGRNCVKRYE